MESHIDGLPDNVQHALYTTFSNATLRNKIIFLSRLHHGNEFNYKDISNAVGVTFQRVQQLYDTMLNDVRKMTRITTVASGVIS